MFRFLRRWIIAPSLRLAEIMKVIFGQLQEHLNTANSLNTLVRSLNPQENGPQQNPQQRARSYAAARCRSARSFSSGARAIGALTTATGGRAAAMPAFAYRMRVSGCTSNGRTTSTCG